MDPNSPVTTIALIGLMVVAFYFLMIRPQRKRQQKQQETLNALVPGTRVLLGSGLFGTILRIGDKQAVLELSPGHELTVLKQAIVRVAGPEDEDNPDSVVSEQPDNVDDAASDADLTTEQADHPSSDSADTPQTWREYRIPSNDDTDESQPDKGSSASGATSTGTGSAPITPAPITPAPITPAPITPASTTPASTGADQAPGGSGQDHPEPGHSDGTETKK